jgi:hypothetical protein
VYSDRQVRDTATALDVSRHSTIIKMSSGGRTKAPRLGARRRRRISVARRRKSRRAALTSMMVCRVDWEVEVPSLRAWGWAYAYAFLDFGCSKRKGDRQARVGRGE